MICLSVTNKGGQVGGLSLAASGRRSAKGRLEPSDRGPANGRFRRVLPADACSKEGRLTPPIPATQPWLGELGFMPAPHRILVRPHQSIGPQRMFIDCAHGRSRDIGCHRRRRTPCRLDRRIGSIAAPPRLSRDPCSLFHGRRHKTPPALV